MWWHVPVVPAAWEAEARESLESGRQRLRRAKITQLHSSLGNRARPCLKKKKSMLGFQMPLTEHPIQIDWSKEGNLLPLSHGNPGVDNTGFRQSLNQDSIYRPAPFCWPDVLRVGNCSVDCSGQSPPCHYYYTLLLWPEGWGERLCQRLKLFSGSLGSSWQRGCLACLKGVAL